MLLNDRLYPEDTPFFPPEKHDILGEIEVKALNAKGKFSNRYLIVTRLQIYLFKPKVFSKAMVPDVTFPWSDLQKLKCKADEDPGKSGRSELALQFKYGDPPAKLNLRGAVLPLFQECHKFILRVMLPQERPRVIEPAGYHAKAVKPSVADYLTLKIRLDGTELTHSQKSSLDRFLKKVGAAGKRDDGAQPCHTFRLNQLSLLTDYLHVFVRALVWIPAITELVVPCDYNYPRPGLTALLKSFLRDTKTITKVTFRGHLPGDFHEFIQDFLSREHHAVRTLAFESADLSPAHLAALAEWLRDGTIRRLEFPKSIPPKLARTFLDHLDGNPGAQHLTHLTLDGTATLEFGRLLPLIPSVTHLSVAQCGCEIASVFKAFTSLADWSLRELNVSANKCMQLIGDEFTLPHTLQRILVNDIFWASGMSLEHFFAAVASHACDGKLELEIKDVKGLTEEKWNHFFKTLRKKGDFLFQTIVWDGNPLSKRFFEFLGRCARLEVLSLTGCFDRKDEEVAQACGHFLSENRTITHFTCAGNERRVLGLTCSRLLIAALVTNQTVSAFDIRGNAAGPKMLLTLAALFPENRTLQSIHIEDNQITDIKDYERFFRGLVTKGSRVRVAWPEKEIEMMVQYGTATQKEMVDLRALWEQIQRPG
jgi:hypothetical protein